MAVFFFEYGLQKTVMLLVQTPVTWSASKMVFESAGARLAAPQL